MSDQRVDRRGFLKGSALFAAAGVLATVPAVAAQEPAPQAPADEKKKEAPAEKKPEEKKPGALYDKNGREYRVCDMCGGNMYIDEKRWTCEQCGFSYEV